MKPNTIFQEQPIPSQSFFARIFGLIHGKGFAVELINLLSRAENLKDIKSEDLTRLIEKYKIKKLHNVSKNIWPLFDQLCSQLKLSDFENGIPNDIVSLASPLGLYKEDISERINATAMALLQKEVEVIMRDHEVTDQESAHMDNMTKILGLTVENLRDVIATVIAPIFRAVFDRALEDGKLSPQEEREIKRLSKALKIDLQLDDKMQDALDDAKHMWQITEGKIPEQNSPLMLQKNELCYRVTEARALETRTRTRSITYGGPAVRVRIMKGVYYRVGNARISRQTEEYSHELGYGDLVLTDKRLLFKSANKSLAIRLNRIVDFEPYIDGVQIYKDTGKPITFVFDRNDKFFGTILDRAIREY